MPSVREAAVPLYGTVGAAVRIAVTAPDHLWSAGSTAATVQGVNGVLVQTFAESFVGNTATFTLSAAQTAAMGKGVWLWALGVGDIYWLGGRFTLNYPGEGLSLVDSYSAVTVAVDGLLVEVSVLGTGGAGGGTDAEVVRDTIAAALVAGPNVTITPNDAGDTITISSSGGGVTDPEVVRDTMGSALVAGSNVTITPNDAGDQIVIASIDTNTTDPEVVRDTIGSTLVAGANVTISVNDAGDTITIAATGGGGSTDVEVVRDTIAAALVAGTGVTITPNDAGDTITIAATGGGTVSSEDVQDIVAAMVAANPGGISFEYADNGTGTGTLAVYPTIATGTVRPAHREGLLFYDETLDPPYVALEARVTALEGP